MNHHGFPLPVLALDVGEVFGIIFLVLSVLGWIVKAIKGQNGNGPIAPGRKPQPDLSRLEIEEFLKEVTGGSVRNSPARSTPSNRPQPTNQRPPAAKKPQRPQKPAKPLSANKPVAGLAQQHLAKSNVGEGLRTHVSNFVKAERIPAEVQKDLKNRIAADVQIDLGRGELSSSVHTASRPAPHPLITLLRNPEGIRQAIALQEILQRPRALRRD